MKKIFSVTILCAGVLALGITALAINPFEEIEYPIQELGNCENRAECKAYCDVPENLEACLLFAERIGMVSKEDAEIARRLGNKTGPGGCQGMDECEAYCDNIDNIEECLAFAEENDIVPQRELEEMRKVAAAVSQGIKPPCNSKRECDAICHKPEHMEKCIEFAEAAGFMPEHEKQEARKMLEAIKRGIKPPDCGGPDECDIYCSKPENMKECMEFGIAAGFVPPEEIEDMKMTLKAIEKGVLPPDCRSKEECDEYCSKPENVQQCMEFAKAAGFMTEEEVEMFEKTGGKGPGGCMGEAECHEFCENPDNIRECLQFGVMIGDMTQEEADRIIQDMEKWGKRENTGGPGGCKSEAECQTYCNKPENIEECMNFGPGPDGGPMGPGPNNMMGPQGGPGGCKTPEECETFCQNPNNAVECIWMQVGMGKITEQQAKEMEQALRIERGEWGDPNQPSHDGPPLEGMPYPEDMPPPNGQYPKEWKEGPPPTGEYREYPPPEGGMPYPGEDMPPDNMMMKPENIQDMMGPDGMMGPPPGEYLPQEGNFEGQYQDEFQKHYDEEFERQYREQYNQMMPGEFGSGPDGTGDGQWQEGPFPEDQWLPDDSTDEWPKDSTGEWQEPPTEIYPMPEHQPFPEPKPEQYPMPGPESDYMPMPSLDGNIEPPTSDEPPKTILDPFSKFLGSVVEFLLGD